MEPSTFVWYALGAALVYVLMSALDKGLKAQKKRRLQRSTCDDAPTIFVLMYAYKDNYAAASTMRHMLLHALCPARLSFGIVQCVTLTSKDVYGLYQQASAYDPYVSKTIRVKTFHAGQYPTTLEAYDIALDQLYAGETYVLITTPGTIFAEQFDVELTKQYRSLPTKRAVLTSHGKKFTMGQVKPSATPNILTYMAATFPEHVPVDQTAWFPCYQSYDNCPILTARAAPNIQERPIPAIACSTICSFFKGPPSFHYGGEDGWDASFVLSNALFQQRYRFYASPRTVAFPRTTSPKFMVKTHLEGSGSGYYNYAGVDRTTYECYGRARLGLRSGLTAKDIERKYGNDENFQIAKSTL